MVLGNLHEVVVGVLRAREARERGGIAGESGSLLLQRQSAVVPVSPGGEESSNFGLEIFHWLPQADLSPSISERSWELIFPAVLKPWFQEFSEEGDHSTRQISDCSTSRAESIIVDVLHNDGGDLLGLHGDHGRESGSTSRIW